MAAKPKGSVSTMLTILAVAVGTLSLGFVIQLLAVATAVPSTTYPQGDVSGSRTSWVQFLGVAGLFIGFIYTAKSYRLTRQSRTTDALIAAVENVGDRDSQIRRAGGIYALGVLIDQDSRTRDDVEHLLCAFVRDRTRYASASSQIEVLDALILISSRPSHLKRESRRPNIQGAHLEGVTLYGANLENCDLRGAHLEGANLTDAHLGKALLTGCQLDDAILQGCNLDDTLMDSCSVNRTDFYGSSNRGLRTEGTDMTVAINYVPSDPSAAQEAEE